MVMKFAGYISLLSVGSVMMLIGCAGGAAEFALRPTPILCQQAQEYAPNYIYYDELMMELNERGEDCAEYIRPDTIIDVK
jgi:hypothetical protein